MMRGSRSSVDLCNMVYNLSDTGLSGYQIWKRTQISYATVKRILNRRIIGTNDQRMLKRGRPRKTNAINDRRLISAVKRNRFSAAQNFVDISGRHISRWTVARRIKEAKLKLRLAIIDVLNAQQKRVRIIWCQTNLNLDFHTIIFSDECTYQLRKCQKLGKQKCYRKVNERFVNQCIIRNPVATEQGSVTVWACFASTGFGLIQIMRTTMNSERYVQTLNNFLLPSINLLFPNNNNYQFMQDNAAPHRANIVRDWFTAHNVPVLANWPAYSPDLNPIENVWGLIKRKVRATLPTNLAQVEQAFRNCWLQLQPRYATDLINSMHNRLRGVIRRRGLRV
jgi:transposase